MLYFTDEIRVIRWGLDPQRIDRLDARQHVAHSEHSSSSGVHGLVVGLDKSADVFDHDALPVPSGMFG
jgi:hypothetical protein